MYTKLNALLTKQDRVFLLFLIAFSIIIALVETVGIAAIMPFISVASDFNLIESNLYYNYIYEYFGFNRPINFVMTFGFLLVLFYVLRGILNLFYFYLLAHFSNGRTHLLAYRLFENYLGMTYHQFINKNSSELSKAIINETRYLTVILSATLLIISEIFVVIFIYVTMLYINWKITLVMTIFLSINIFFLIRKISPVIKLQGIARETYQKKFYEIINSSFGNFKIIKLQTNEKMIMEEFNIASSGFAKSGTIYETLANFPRIFLETIGFSLIALIIIYLIFKFQTDIASILGILSMFVLGLYRLLPSANRLLNSYNQIVYYRKSLDLIHNDLMYDGEKLGDHSIVFNKQITIQSLSFGYNDNNILENINLVIQKNQKIALIGPSGSGKSTLVDIIIGLYKPKKGDIVIDNNVLNEENVKAWRKQIGYIPQSVYLFDGTVGQNIAFGLEYDEIKIRNVLNKAKILNFLEKNADGINTFVGEGGIKLSGGQKQRIAIARALYQNPQVLVLDEATSALDEEIEAEIMHEIYRLCEDKTLVIIAHRLSTINGCDKVYRIENKSLIEEK